MDEKRIFENLTFCPVQEHSGVVIRRGVDDNHLHAFGSHCVVEPEQG